MAQPAEAEALAWCELSGDTGRVIELTEPQVWTLIGVFSTVLFGVFAMMSGHVVRSMKAGFDRVDAQFDRVDAQIAGLRGEMNAKFAVVDVKFDRLDDRFDHLDRDVQTISRRVFPDM